MERDFEYLIKENESLKKELNDCRKIITGYENVLQLNDLERENNEEIIKMYEIIVEYSRNELMLASETVKARENISQLGREELITALTRIQKLEEENRKLKERMSQR
ncbi:MAG TPA: hypothetical protein PLI62_11375 [Spirochaetota bacterium]|nr:hypothetical protein [Spirochaetota bacterium]